MPKGQLATRRPSADPSPQLIEVKDLSGGLDLRRSPTLLAPDRARVLRNYSLREPGALLIHAGYQAYSSNSLGSDRIQGGVRAYLASTQMMLIAYNGGVYEVRDAPAGQINSTALYSTISSTNQIYFPYDRTLVAVMDSTNRPRKSTDGQDWTRMGIDAGTVASTASSVAGGDLSTSEFEFSYSYKDRGVVHESNECTIVTTRSLSATGAISLQIPNSSDQQVDAIVIYGRNKTAGELVRRKATSGPITSAAASSTIVVTSSNWSANDEAPTNHQVPVALEFAVVWKNRWWGKDPTVGNRLRFTELFQPQSWPTLFFIDIPFERGDEIAAGIGQGDTLVLFGQSRVFLIIGQTSLDFEVRPSAGAQAGAVGPRAIALIEQGILHFAAEGFYVFDGATDKLLTFDIEPAVRDLMNNAAATAISQIAVVHQFREKVVRAALPRLFPRGTRGEFELDLNRTREKETVAWTDTDRDIIGYIQMDGDEPIAGNRGRLFSWPSSGGRLFEESTGTSGNSSNLIAEYEGPHVATGLHRARVHQTYLEYEPNGGAFSAEVVIDSLSDGSQGINIGSGVARYGTALYGRAVYAGSGRRVAVLTHRLEAEGRTVWLKTSYTGQSAFRWFTYAHEITPESAVRTFND